MQQRWEHAPLAIEQWRCAEWELASAVAYADPFGEVEVTATFLGPGGSKLVRPAFWDGDASWKIRFAPVTVGTWSVTVACSDAGNAGLNRSEPWTFECVPYAGTRELYQRGFLRVEAGARHLRYADGTPFFYLGDTHWFMPAEDYEGSNVDGVASQFQYMVDHRVSQGFTVYQSEPLVTSGPHLDCDEGIRESSLPLLRNMDRKFAYIADSGLVHANAALTFSSMLRATDMALLEKLGQYWAARYGAYPVLWTVAQEIDPDFYHQLDPQYWQQIGRSIHRHDCYSHPLTAHMEYNAVSGWGGLEGHSWHALQPLDLSKEYMESFWKADNAKPYLAYETRYEHNNQPTGSARSSAYRAVMNGSYGYGYGVQGVWALNNSPDDWFHYGPYYRWFDGLNAEAGRQMRHFRAFFAGLQWWRLQPCFRDTAYGDFADRSDAFLMVDGNRTYLAFFTGNTCATGVLKQMAETPYEACWFDIRTGSCLAIPGPVHAQGGEWAIPPRPEPQDWLLLVTSAASALQRQLAIQSPGEATTIFRQGGTLPLTAVAYPDGEALDTVWRVTGVDGEPTAVASIDAAGVLQARRDGIVLVWAALADGSLAGSRQFIIARQQKVAPLRVAESIAVEREGQQFFVRFQPADAHDQRVAWSVFAVDGKSPADNVYISPYGVLSCLEAGKVKVVAAVLDGSELSAEYEYDVPAHNDVIRNPLLEGAVATASSSDWVNGYRPGKALASERGNWMGWSSKTAERDDELPSLERPQWLEIALRQPTRINRLELYTTGVGMQLRDFDIESWDGEQWTALAQIRGNALTEVCLRFPPLVSSKLRVLCYKGDMMGIARISAIEIYWDGENGCR